MPRRELVEHFFERFAAASADATHEAATGPEEGVVESARVGPVRRTIADIRIEIDTTAGKTQWIRSEEPSCARIIVTIAQIDEAALGINLLAGEAKAAQGVTLSDVERHLWVILLYRLMQEAIKD